MNSLLPNHISLDLLLRAAALAQLAVAFLNLFLIRIMKWKPDLDRAPLLIREVFRIHVVFISITLSIFAALTWRFAHEMARAGSPLAIWLAVAIGSGYFRSLRNRSAGTAALHAVPSRFLPRTSVCQPRCIHDAWNAATIWQQNRRVAFETDRHPSFSQCSHRHPAQRRTCNLFHARMAFQPNGGLAGTMELRTAVSIWKDRI